MNYFQVFLMEAMGVRVVRASNKNKIKTIHLLWPPALQVEWTNVI